MAKKRSKVQGADIDWYLISIDRLKQIGLVVLLILLGTGGYFFWQSAKGNPRSNAESAINDARQALNALAASKEFASRRNQFDRAQRKLEEANSSHPRNTSRRRARRSSRRRSAGRRSAAQAKLKTTPSS